MAWDRYAYAQNSPVMYIDPTGHVTTSVDCKHLSDGYCFTAPSKPTLRNSPIDLNTIDSIQYFGGTEYAYQHGDEWNYDGDCGGYHCGMDFGGDWDDLVFSSTIGMVVAITLQNTGSAIVIVQYGNYHIEYWNVDPVVEIGQMVYSGTLIGKLRNHSNDSTDTNTHVHLELKSASPELPRDSIKDRRHNPLLFMSNTLQVSIINLVEEKFKHEETTSFHNPEANPYNQPIYIGSVTQSFWGY